MTDNSNSSLSPRIRERIAEDFTGSDRDAVADLLVSLDGPSGAETVRHAIITVAGGSVEEARIQADLARVDHRDVLWNAERHRSGADKDPRS